MKKKRTLALMLSAALCVGLLAGCGSSSDPGTAETSSSSTGTGETSAALTGTVNVSGSTSMEEVVGALKESYASIESGVTISYSGTGSSAGIESVLNGTCDIGLSSRALTEDEEAQGAVGHTIALDGVAIIVNSANTVSDLTVEQIAQIFTGEITNWSELGGDDVAIAVIGREASSGTRGAFEEIVGVEDACAYTNEQTSTGDVISNVSSNPGAIGYASLSALNDSVKAVSVNGVAPSEETVLDGTYTIQRPFVMVTRAGTELSAAAQAFLEYAMSADVADIIANAGAVPPQQ